MDTDLYHSDALSIQTAQTHDFLGREGGRGKGRREKEKLPEYPTICVK